MEKVIDTDACKYNAIDLGLPSGLKWADRNVGAATPEAFGDYFAWGETKPRGENWATEAPYDWAHAPFNNGSKDFDKKYFSNHKSEWVNKDGTLKSDYDAAHVNIGDGWRMPTYDEIWELIDGTMLPLETLNGVEGLRFTSKTNGNSIFMPLTGYRVGSGVCIVGNYGDAWSSSLNAGLADNSHDLNFSYNCYAYVNYYYRYGGLVVRGVHE